MTSSLTIAQAAIMQTDINNKESEGRLSFDKFSGIGQGQNLTLVVPKLRSESKKHKFS